MASEKIFGLPGAPLSPESLQTGRTVVCEFLDGHRRAEIIGQRPLWNKATNQNPAGYYVRVRFVDKQWGICNVCVDTMHAEAVTDVEAAAYDLQQPVTVETKPAASISPERCAAALSVAHLPDTPHHRELAGCLGQKWNELELGVAAAAVRIDREADVGSSADVCGGAREEGVHGGRVRVPGLRVPRSTCAGDRPWCCEVIFMAVREEPRATDRPTALARSGVVRTERAERFVVLFRPPRRAIGSSTAVAEGCAARWWRRAQPVRTAAVPIQRPARVVHRSVERGCIGLRAGRQGWRHAAVDDASAVRELAASQHLSSARGRPAGRRRRSPAEAREEIGFLRGDFGDGSRTEAVRLHGHHNP